MSVVIPLKYFILDEEKVSESNRRESEILRAQLALGVEKICQKDGLLTDDIDTEGGYGAFRRFIEDYD